MGNKWLIVLFFLSPIPLYADVCAIVTPTYPGTSNYESFARTSANNYKATSFTVSASCNDVTGVATYVSRDSGARSDNLNIGIWSDSGGAPGSSLETNDGNATGGSPTFTWGTTTFAGTLDLQVSTTYWVVWSADTLDNSNWFEAGRNTVTSGNTRNWNGSTWDTSVNDSTHSMAFAIEGTASGGGGSGSTSTSTEDLINAYTHFYMWNFLAYAAGLCGTLYIWRRVRS